MAKIVIVEDEPILRNVIATKLRTLGHSVSEAGDGKSGEEMIVVERPDLILLDVWMPEQDGIATIVNLRKQIPQLKIIVMSGAPTGAGLRLFDIVGTLGAVATLEKPFSAESLVSAVESALGN